MKHKWLRKRERKDHTDDWLMTYADMITLLLCFFAVFLFASIAVKPKEKTSAPVVQVEAKPVKPSPVDLPAFEGQETLPPQPAPPPDVQGPPPPPVIMGNLPFHDSTFDTVPTAKPEPPVEPQQTPQTPVVQQEPSAPLDVKPAPEPPPQSPKGDMITVMEMNSSTFFASGSAVLSPAGKAALKPVIEKIKDAKYNGYRVIVEGHTDDTPIHTVQFPSNWELSTARASAVVQFFIESGLSPQRLRASGYADAFPKLPNRDANGTALPENQSRNRRVAIKLERIEKVE